MKLQREEIINEIMKEGTRRQEEIRNEFDPPLRDEEIKFMYDPINWKLYNEETDEYIFGKKVIERIYNCEPLDDQLRSYVYTDPEDKIILKVEILTE